MKRDPDATGSAGLIRVCVCACVCAVVVASGFVFTKGLAHCGCTLLLLSIFNLVLVNHVLIRIGCIIAFGVGSFGAHRTKTTLAGSEITLCATCSHKSAKDVSIECLRYCMPRLQNSDVSTTDTGNTWIFFSLFEGSMLHLCWAMGVAGGIFAEQFHWRKLYRLFDWVVLWCSGTSILGISATGQHIGF